MTTGVTTTTLAVAPGSSPTCLLSNMPTGCLIFNNDLVNSVWVSENQSVAPGIGFEIGPQGYCTWANDGESVYAVVDTGVVTPVTVTIGDALSDINNPVAIATATAIALEASGIPIAAVTQEVYSNVIAPGQTVTLDISKWSTLVFVGEPGPNIQMAQTDVSNVSMDEELLPGNCSGQWRAVGTKLTLTNTSGSTGAGVTVIGTTRQIPTRWDARNQDSLGYHWTLTTTFAAGDDDPLTPDATNASQIVGPQMLEVHVTNTTVQGTFYAVLTDGRTIVLADTHEMAAATFGASSGRYLTKQIAMPSEAFTIRFTCTTASGASVRLHVNMIPAQV